MSIRVTNFTTDDIASNTIIAIINEWNWSPKTILIESEAGIESPCVDTLISK